MSYDYTLEEYKALTKPLGVDAGRCRCKVCKDGDIIDRIGPIHFYFAGRCLGYFGGGVYTSYVGHTIRLNYENINIKEQLVELIKRDIGTI